MGKNTTSTSSLLKKATYASMTHCALVLWPAKTHGNLGGRYQRGRRILQTGGLRGSMRVRQLTGVCHRGHYEGMSRCRLVGSYVLPSENFFTYYKTTFARLTQSQAISSIAFSSLSDQQEGRKSLTFFHFSKFFLYKITRAKTNVLNHFESNLF